MQNIEAEKQIRKILRKIKNGNIEQPNEVFLDLLMLLNLTVYNRMIPAAEMIKICDFLPHVQEQVMMRMLKNLEENISYDLQSFSTSDFKKTARKEIVKINESITDFSEKTKLQAIIRYTDMKTADSIKTSAMNNGLTVNKYVSDLLGSALKAAMQYRIIVYYSDGSTMEENDFCSKDDVDGNMLTYINVMKKYSDFKVRVIKVELWHGDKIVKTLKADT